MDLKKYAGKHIFLQLKGSEPWFVTKAKADSTAEILMMGAGEKGAGDPGRPVSMPCIQGMVTDDGDIEVETGNGGVVAVSFSPDVIHSVSVATKPSEAVEQGRIIQVARPQN